MSTSSFSHLLPLNFYRPNKCNLFFSSPLPPLSSSNPSSHRSLSSSTTLLLCSSSSNYEKEEEARWLREEQRWLREEQRWLREESRWRSERQFLLDQISELKLRIEELSQQGQGEVSVPRVTAAALLPILNRIAESGTGALPLVLEAEAEVEREKVEEEEGEKKKKKRGTLRKGSEGEEVRELQEALQKLGFYCGEEDVEFSSFSTGTERAVKTWQASQSIPEDGIMAAELQEMLHKELQEGPNGASVVSKVEISEIQHKIEKNKGAAEFEVSNNRVFLLGENRWEDPSRLNGRNKQIIGAKGTSAKCLPCRGEGRLLCAECDGSGEPNIEPQFIEWVDEGMKCPYCDGLGFTTCDVCDGKGEAVV